MSNSRGFTLVEILIAVAMLGVLSLGIMHLSKNMSNVQQTADSKGDEIEMRTSIRMLLDNDKFCRVSLAGNGALGTPSSPVLFNKNSIDQANEGLPIELFTSNQNGTARVTKKFSATDVNVQNYGKIKITRLVLQMNNGVGFNYAQSFAHSDIGEIVVDFEKKVQSTTRTDTMRFPVNIGMRTDSGGNTTLLSCSQMSQEISEELVCQMAGKFYDESKSPKCQNSQGNYAQLIGRGGSGGVPTDLACPHGMAIASLQGRAGGEVDAITIGCVEINSETLSPFGNVLYKDIIGGTGGSSFSLSCPSGMIASGLTGRAGSRIDRIGLRCTNYTTGSSAPTAQFGGGGGALFNDNCPSDTFLRGILVHVGARVDRVRGYCF